MVQLKCETDFSAKNDGFTSLVQALAESVRDRGPAAVDEHAVQIEDLKLTLKENIQVGVVERLQAADGNVLDAYLHRQDGRGVNAVVVEGSGVDAAALHQVALHIAFAKPEFLSAGEIPAAEIERERAALLEITKAEGKPEPAWEQDRGREDAGLVRRARAARAGPSRREDRGEGQHRQRIDRPVRAGNDRQLIVDQPADGARAPARRSARWRRVLLKLSGEAFAGGSEGGIDGDTVRRIAAGIAEARVNFDVEIAVVVGAATCGGAPRARAREWTAPRPTTWGCWPR